MPIITSNVFGDLTEESGKVNYFPQDSSQDTLKKGNSVLGSSFDLSNLMSFVSKPDNFTSNDSRADLGLFNLEMRRNDMNGNHGHASRLLQAKMLDSFIPGAISNRTLEYLTESTLRPKPVLKNEGLKQWNFSPGNGQNSFGMGAIGDRNGAQKCVSPPESNRALLDILSRNFSPPGANINGNSYHSNQQNPYDPVYGEISHGTSSNHDSLSPALDLVKALGLQTDIPLHKRTNHGMFQQPLYNDFSMSADLFANRPWTSLNGLFSTTSTDPQSIDRAAKLYRSAATISEPTCTWSGQLPARVHRNPVYSIKVFLGGVPWDITEAGLHSCLRCFGPFKIEWPGKDGKHPRYPTKGKELPVGYVYILFEVERSVRALLQACTHDFSNGGEYFFQLSSKRMRSKEVQIIPWVISDSNYVRNPSQRLEPHKTVFVGALHGMMNAEGLGHILNDLFGNVVYAGIDTDKHKYPIGSGRVTFSSQKSYIKAVTAAFVEVKTSKFTKKIQIDPYLEESECNICQSEQGIYFCRDFKCFLYYCRTCWQAYHSAENTRFHKPLMRNNNKAPCSNGNH